jgi:hypothetical protein
MENLDPRQIQTIKAKLIKLGRIDNADDVKSDQNFITITPAVPPHKYAKCNTFVTFYAWLSFYPFHIIFLLTSTSQTGKLISIFEGSNDALPPKDILFGVSLEKN